MTDEQIKLQIISVYSTSLRCRADSVEFLDACKETYAWVTENRVKDTVGTRSALYRKIFNLTKAT